MGGGGGGGGVEIIYLSLQCHHQNGTCIKMGSDESHFNVSLIVRDKVTRQCPQTTTFSKSKRRAEAESNRGPSAYKLRPNHHYRLGHLNIGYATGRLHWPLRPGTLPQFVLAVLERQQLSQKPCRLAANRVGNFMSEGASDIKGTCPPPPYPPPTYPPPPTPSLPSSPRSVSPLALSIPFLSVFLCPSVCLSASLYMCNSLSLFLCPSVRPSVCLSLYVYLPVSLSLSICLPASISMCMCLCVSFSILLSVCLSPF